MSPPSLQQDSEKDYEGDIPYVPGKGSNNVVKFQFNVIGFSIWCISI